MTISDAIREKALFPKELLSEVIQKDNDHWMQEYFLSKNVGKGYKDKLKNFFRYKKFAEKPFYEFTKKDIDDFIEVLIENNYTESGINPFLSAIREFKEYLIEKDPYHFHYFFLKDLKGEYFYNQNQDKDRALNLETLCYIRNYIMKNSKTQYMFELIYQLGIEKQQLESCLPEYADLKLKASIVGDSNISFENSPYIEDLIKEARQVENFKITYYMFSDHMKKLSLHLLTNGIYDKKILHSTILNTHRAYFLTCPNCGTVLENISENWVLAKTELSENYCLVCVRCKGVSR